MKFKIISTQPQIYDSFLTTGLISRGINKKIIEIELYNLHDFAFDKHKSIDDSPYGGGAGMVLRVDVVSNAIKKLKGRKKIKTILLTPQGKVFNQADARRLAKEKELIFIAGRFEGYDERIRNLVDEEISVGDFVLTSGDLPTMTIIDSTSRHVPGFIEKEASIQEESFVENLLEYPQYTRPEVFNDEKVPEVLLSGNHAVIAKWRKEKQLEKTKKRRPELL
ncbi:TPA: tRNA (guanosine(37)-N1)-methyltransferase TrmD [Candidatus Berkelbacteria bacterium]|uniref:tRNA (guanine-N(1)-)-methyltransferase n=1 Tax=Berkelbacteria bacterium GW2011_GWE1_39_12 TaxID=1618337 RepID=A0A0G4B3M6_9BACT|nr:MAG: tRNA (guanine-N1)-methyltransferase, tRNA (guanine37-N1)-methyltransferase [Berkelbacteria bacterium GW2011_GWE1_39_12]HBO60355.1 tRNA (guanosine(37)-N1)-methyltransferase TrmD [Candidatus Berkelbacteria bacterium]